VEEVWKEVLSDFDAVWQRVQGKAPEAPPATREAPGKAGLLQSFLRAEGEAESCYGAMAKLAPRRDADLLRGMALECGRNRGLLRTEYFLLTGEEPPTVQERFPHDGYLGHIRRAYHREGALADRYLAASAEPLEPRLRETFSALSAAAAGRREQLYAMAQRILK